MPCSEATIAHGARPAAPSRRFLRLVRSRRIDRTVASSFEATPIATDSGVAATADYVSPGAALSVRGRHRDRTRAEPGATRQPGLRTAVGLLFLLLGLLFVRNLFLPEFDLPLLVIQAATLMGLGTSLGALLRGPKVARWVLRGIELAAFGCAVGFFATAEYRLMLLRLLQDDPALSLATIKNAVLSMCAVMAIYGMFIPNDWRRAVLIVAPMALMPPAIALTVLWRHPELASVAVRGASFEQVSENALMLVFGAIGSVAGAHHRVARIARQTEDHPFGPYRLRERIGTGGMGEVYLAEHQQLKRLCAIKLIRPGRAAEPKVLARFEREVRATARLSHANTIEIYDCGRTEDGTLYYVMEYLPGLNLAELVERFGPLPPARAIHLLRQACLALDEAHAAGLIHRDIKPANLVAAYRGGRYDVAKLLDFGLVKPAIGRLTGAAAQVSHDGMITGSPLYMSPEQALSEPIDHRSDLYSLGAVAYYLLTGHPPFPGVNAVRVMLAHAHDPVPPLTRHQPDLPADLEQVILRCLAKSPADRFADAESLELALASCADANHWTPQRAAEWWRAVVSSPSS